MGENNFCGENGYIKSNILEKSIVSNNEKKVLLLKESGIRKEICGDFKTMDSFEGVYSQEEIEDDKKFVIETENNFYIRNKLENKNQFGEKSGDDLEYILENKAEKNSWLGEGSCLTKTLYYDDLRNKVDFVVEYNDGLEQVALMVDTSNSKNDHIREKMAANALSVKQGNRKIKYFESKICSYKGPLENIIPVVIGVDSIHTEEMIDHLNDENYFKDHPTQILFLEEIKMQLDNYSEICPRYTSREKNRLGQINLLREKMDEIMGEKNVLQKQVRTKMYRENDATYSMIAINCDRKKAPSLN